MGQLIEACGRCMFHNVNWPKECEWSNSCATVGEKTEHYDCVLFTTGQEVRPSYKKLANAGA